MKCLGLMNRGMILLMRVVHIEAYWGIIFLISKNEENSDNYAR